MERQSRLGGIFCRVSMGYKALGAIEGMSKFYEGERNSMSILSRDVRARRMGSK